MLVSMVVLIREGEIPVPIPNTAVKPFSADTTCCIRSWKRR